MTQLVATYMQDHHAGAVAGLEAFKRVAEQHSDPHVRTVVGSFVEELREERAALEEMLKQVGDSASTLKDVAAWTGEKLGRLKPNQRVISRSPLSDFIELEVLILGVHGKSLMWQALQALEDERLDAAQLRRLADQAAKQEAALTELRLSQVPKLHEE